MVGPYAESCSDSVRLVKANEQKLFVFERWTIDWEELVIWPAGKAAHCFWDHWEGSGGCREGLGVKMEWVTTVENR